MFCALDIFSELYFQEDPMEDMRHLQLSKNDSILVITSAGDNALHYAINAQPKRVCSFSTKSYHSVLTKVLEDPLC